MSGRIIAFTADLLFASNIEATLGRAGYDVTTVEDLSALEARVADGRPAVVIFDLHSGPSPRDIVERTQGAPVLAFGRHTEPAMLRAARDAGCAQVVVRSTFVEEMVALVAALVVAPRPTIKPREA